MSLGHFPLVIRFFEFLLECLTFFCNGLKAIDGVFNAACYQGIIHVKLLELYTFDEEFVFVHVRGSIQELTGVVLSENIDWIVELKSPVVCDVVEFRSFRANHFSSCAFDLEGACSLDRKVTFHDDRVAILLRFVGISSLVP